MRSLKEGFTLIELLVVIAIIALLSSVVLTVLTTARSKARDSQRIRNAHELSLALEQYESTENTYRVAGAGYANSGGGYVAKGAETLGYSNSIITVLSAKGYYTADTLSDPIYGTDNYYLGMCTSTYSVFLKVEQPELQQSSSTIASACDGVNASAAGFNFIAGGGDYGAASGVAAGGGFITSLTGDVDPTFVSGQYGGADGSIYDLRIQSDGKVVVVGNFSSMFNGSSRRGVARVNGDGSLDANFAATCGLDVGGSTLETQSDGKIIVGGGFSTYCGSSSKNLVRLNPDGSIDTSFIGNGAPDGAVRTMKFQQDGKLIIGGDFLKVGGVSSPHIARLNVDGSLDSSFSVGSGFDQYPLSLAVQSDGKIVAAGIFVSFNGTARNHVARLNGDGSLDVTFTSPIIGGSFAQALSIQSDGKIIVGGGFGAWNFSYYNLLRMLPDGTIDSSFNTGTAPDSTVYSTLVLPNGEILISGAFNHYNGVTRNKVALLKSDGTLDTGFASVADTINYILALGLQSDGRVILGGTFTSYGGIPQSDLARVQ